MLHGIFGNATEVDVKGLQRDLESILVEGEQVVKGFRIIRDYFVFTDKRLIRQYEPDRTRIQARRGYHRRAEDPGAVHLAVKIERIIS